MLLHIELETESKSASALGGGQSRVGEEERRKLQQGVNGAVWAGRHLIDTPRPSTSRHCEECRRTGGYGGGGQNLPGARVLS